MKQTLFARGLQSVRTPEEFPLYRWSCFSGVGHQPVQRRISCTRKKEVTPCAMRAAVEKSDVVMVC